jgi:glutamyl-tRNA synthetase
MTDTVTVRFAPSPTGYLHLGGARTALYNYIFARQRGGTFILRIEDTDLSRSTDEAIAQIVRSMKEMGLDWDEGPGVPGPHGPYRQTERQAIYREHIDRLLASGHLYTCFCTPEQLEAERQAAQAEKRDWVYGGTCRSLGADEVERRKSGGEPWTLRFKAPGGRIGFDDMLRGRVEVDGGSVGDFIVQRSDGSITYNLAVVVDDVTMEITHVIRGDDHISNTPKQVPIYEALGAATPRFLHMPLLFGTDRKKLSKRHGATDLEQLVDMGFLSEVVRNYLCFLSTEFDETMIDWTLDDLVRRFKVEEVGTSASIFDPDKLRWMNGRLVRSLDDEALGERLVAYLERTGFYADPSGWTVPAAGADAARRPAAPSFEQDRLTRALAPLVHEKIEVLADVVPIAGWFFRPLVFSDEAQERLRATAEAERTLPAAAAHLRALEPYTVEGVEALVRALPEELGIKPKAVFAALRLGMSGQPVTPGLFESLWLLGRDEAADRLMQAAALIA